MCRGGSEDEFERSFLFLFFFFLRPRCGELSGRAIFSREVGIESLV